MIRKSHKSQVSSLKVHVEAPRSGVQSHQIDSNASTPSTAPSPAAPTDTLSSQRRLVSRVMAVSAIEI